MTDDTWLAHDRLRQLADVLAPALDDGRTGFVLLAFPLDDRPGGPPIDVVSNCRPADLAQLLRAAADQLDAAGDRPPDWQRSPH